MYTKAQLKAAFKGNNNISLNDVYKDVRRYGNIKHLSDVEYNGIVTTYAYIEYKDLSWEFELEKGEVISAQYATENNWIF